jgi:hypothetical protein
MFFCSDHVHESVLMKTGGAGTGPPVKRYSITVLDRDWTLKIC